ncbi:2Fe-2S iron-sulfur cluster-binding protein [Amycolatopsis acidiphila]|uniref:2Fe-2S iron-sulfur cluster-binding protein n=1 Tax=Amycolatopsis acidiphila TaxID=715473 RepID=UPI0016437E67|nr:2Fe-2S iron-sulfur cluster-binding protein [Amycolatopsis acidiphila]UIJ57408.1 2Fe-2S iron-sulfur cluster-binding protein [Amycolatopsis acidiphila]GHG84387.1 sarcosine oxidase subunit alpha [Amycolatopsis acidiphila]
MNETHRTPSGGLIDRDTPLRFTFDGRRLTGYRGDTLASALLANGVHQVATSIRFGRPRGILSAGAEEPNALVQLEEPVPEPMLGATTVELFDGLVARGLPGQGRLAAQPDPARYDGKHVHCDVLVVGAGPAGLVAALTAARGGARVVLVDDQPEPGGALLGSNEHLDGKPAVEWARTVADELRELPGTLVLERTTAFGAYDDGFVLALQRRTDHLGAAAPRHVSRQRVWRIRAKQTVLATGAHERPVVFADNDRPGIMLAGAARTYLHRYAVLPGRRAVLFTTNDSGYAAALDLADADVDVPLILDARPDAATAWTDVCAERGIEVRAGHAVVGTDGEERIAAARTASLDGAGKSRVDCDLLLVAGGWNPAVHLFSQARGQLEYAPGLGAYVPAGVLPAMRVAGAASGALDFASCVREGRDAAEEALSATGFTPAPRFALPASDARPEETPPAVRWLVPGAAPEPDTRFVDLQRDATVSDVLRATGAGLRSLEHIKRYTTIGTAHDQGKTSGMLAGGIVADALGTDLARGRPTTFRPPYTPVAFAALAGRNRGELHDPVRVTAIHPRHQAHGAVFENVGQWHRPWYYPRPGEDLHAAVLRECRAARTGVAMMDASTLGKIDLQGPDVTVFLDRLYPNMMSTLGVGRIRYGVLCGLDGMVIDDGTVIRLAEERFLVTTTTGNAATVLDWMEEWLQTEWPDLDVFATSVTEHWATIALVGPLSREVLGAVAPGLDVANAALGFMSWQDAEVAGIAARVCRISFSGELAYEINVPCWYAGALWDALLAAGEPYGITPYGTETMHVLRAEKGYPVIGQDTDGTVTPQDLGMSWVVSKKKADFVGKRSFSRPENLRPDRKQLVGLLPEDPAVLLPEGAQIIESDHLPEPPVRMLGHVTSSYSSAALGRTFALALVRSGFGRIGETLYVPVGDEVVPVTVTGSVLFDKEGARRDG